MAIIIPNPDNVPGAVTTGYQAQNIVLYAGMVGFFNLNIQNGIISAGSVFELNGSLVKCDIDEPIQNLSSMSTNTNFYIYAVPQSETEVIFNAEMTVPVWSTQKGGYYSNGSRAIMRATKSTTTNTIVPTILNRVLDNTIPQNTGGQVVYSKAVRSHEAFWGVPGWYRYELASGAGNTNGSVSSNLGGSGGGCGAGEETYIISGPQKFGTGRQKPGNGGDSSTNVYGYGNRRLFGGKGHLEDNYYFINKNYLSNVIDYENLAGGDAFSDNNQWKAGKSLMGGTGYDNSQPGTNGGNTLYYGGGGAGGTCNDVYSIYYENGAGGAVAKNCLLLNGTFYHNGGSMIIHIGGNGFNGGNGGRGYNDVGINSGVYGGAGGNGGAPGWYREYGESSAGYAKLYYLGQ